MNKSKLKAKRQQRSQQTKEGVKIDYAVIRRSSIVLAILILSVFGLGALGSYNTLPINGTSVTTGTPPPMPANAPSREYIYAGSALISTVEPFLEAPSDLAVFRPGSGVWYILNGQGQMITQQWGISSDTLAPGDFDGDGKTDFGVVREMPNPQPDSWYIINSSDGSQQTIPFASAGDIPAVEDFDGDGKSDLAVWRPSDYKWYVKQSSTGSTISYPFGMSGDVPVPDDYDGDGFADYAIWRNSSATFWVHQSSTNSAVSYSIGSSGDAPVVGDYDGDAKADYAVRGSDNIWTIRYSSDWSVNNFSWGIATDVAVQGRYNDSSDTDTKADIAIWRNGVWYIRRSSDGSMRVAQWGIAGDKPVPSNWRR